MIKIGFLLNFPLEYKGGINYIKNLLYAIKTVDRKEFHITLFVPNNISRDYITSFSPYAEIIKTPVINRKNPVWLFDKLCEKTFAFNPILEYLLLKHKIQVISHSNFVSRQRKIRSINWIPDFQYLHYPELWPPKQLPNTQRLHTFLAAKSDSIVLSSNNAFDDYKAVYSSSAHKVKVLHFVSQPTSTDLNLLSKADIANAVLKYSEGKPFFYLPNQFWAHKNHILAFKAAKILKAKGYDFLLLTSGVMEDYRNKNQHVNSLRQYVQDNHLTEVIKFLGVIPYKDVLYLIRGSNALINPSLFEGWSSTVEEAKTLGASLILSDISVHREQNPAKAKYVDPNNVEQLAFEMEQFLVNTELEAQGASLNKDLEERTRLFGNTYLDLVSSTISNDARENDKGNNDEKIIH